MRLFYTFLLMTAAVLFGTEVQAQTLPCGSGQVLNVCDCDAEAGTLVADVASCDFSTATNQGYILVDTDNATVSGDADDESIVAYNTSGTFTGVPEGDYTVYYIIYDVADAAMVESFLNTGSSFTDLLALATQTGVGEWTSTSPSFSLSDSPLATVNGPDCFCDDLPAECDGFAVTSEIICGLNSYTVVISLSGASSYNVTSTTGTNGTVSGSFTDGPFALGTGYSYTVVDASNQLCGLNTSQSNITCVVTSVELVSFDGRALEAGNEVFWTTGSEDQSDFFTIERSFDGENFQAVGTVKAAGNSSIAKSYSFLDAEPKAGVNYYRLTETDLDGTTKVVSNVISIESRISLNITNIFPVPASDLVNIEFDANTTSTRVELFDITGKLITAFNYSSVEGANLIPVQIGDYAVGTYFITVSNGVESSTVRFVKSK